ncbi:RNA polymerase [Escherichia phage ECBP5]|uniref:DNA-directed RNA polymerase n=1 Tax=Escherichia phage ECBP5 TaxID=1498172 RepID=A0A0F6N5K2_9CAUD|nr:RNA polymerase [Escherichia phage ECBP5]AID17660.1 putative RNA polymerase [Escherichia phage ECBP5]
MYTSDELYQKQLELEGEMHGYGVTRFDRNNQRAIDSGTPSDTDWNRRLLSNFIEPMVKGINAYKEYYKTKAGRPTVALKYIRQVQPEQAAYIAIKNILDVLGSTTFDANWLVTTIGRRIEDQVRFTKLEEAAPKYVGKVKDSLAKRNSLQYAHQHKVLVATEKKLAENPDRAQLELPRWQEWAEEDCKHVGSLLVNIFEQCILFEGEPVIRKEVQTVRKGTLVFIKPTEKVTKWIHEFREAIGGLAPAYAPCVVPPLDWTSPFTGGFHTEAVSSTLHLAKVRNKRHLRKLTKEQMPAVYKAVNNLQKVRWRISERVLATANTLVELGLPYALPSKDESDWKEKNPCPVPEYLQDLRGEQLKAALTASQWEAFQEWKQLARQNYDEESERVASFREVVRTLGQANRYVGFDAIYFVYTLDFRGRVYCQSSLVSPQGGDLQKALIKFADGMKLGERGEYWFKVHGANEWGWDKKTFDERVALVSEPEFCEMCLDIASDPVTFNDWIKADKPWQFLNWCFEYADFLKHVQSAGNPQDFVSYIPCAMDGSCSGIQHYSAMLRDTVGGTAVNLVNSDKPNDIYGEVCKVTIKELQAIADGSQVYDSKIDPVLAQQLAQEWLRLQPNRSLTKKPVMTLPYGSTQLTCREHVSQWLKDLQKEENKRAKAEFREPMKVHAFGDADSAMPLKFAESLMTSIVWHSIGKVVVAARAGMAYIKAVTSSVAKMNMPLEWTTPTGFIVRQEIYQFTTRQVNTQLLGGTKFVVSTKSKDIDYHRMINSCAPNFVHSMDASHLTLATNYFADAGISSIAVIHDSFGTHAGATDLLRERLRASMVDMYEQHDVITNFLAETEGRLMTAFEHIRVPERGELQLDSINQSTYAFA